LFARSTAPARPVVWICGAPGRARPRWFRATSPHAGCRASGISSMPATNDPASFLHFLGVGARRPPFKPRRLPTLPSEASPDLSASQGSTFVRCSGACSLDGPGPGQLPGSRKRGTRHAGAGSIFGSPRRRESDRRESSRASRITRKTGRNQRIAVVDGRELKFHARGVGSRPPGASSTSTRMRWPRSTPSRRLGCRTGLDRRAPAPIRSRVPHELNSSRHAVFGTISRARYLPAASAADQRLLMLTAACRRSTPMSPKRSAPSGPRRHAWRACIGAICFVRST